MAQVSGTALLPCSVRLSSAPAAVMWIRRTDMSLLTLQMLTYSSDERFSVEHIRHKGKWDLKIKGVQIEDNGLYECQLSVHPVESIFVELRVIGEWATQNELGAAIEINF